MARNTIKFQLKKALEEKASYGRSKHDDKITTYEKRMEMKKQGYSYEERLAVNEMREHIYSYQTMKTYQQQVGDFGEYLISQGLKKITIEERIHRPFDRTRQKSMDDKHRSFCYLQSDRCISARLFPSVSFYFSHRQGKP